MSEHTHDDDAATDEVETFEVPEDLSTLDDTHLGQLAALVNGRGQELAAAAAERDLTDDELAESEDLAEVADELATEQTRRQQLAAERRERAAAAVSRFATATAEETDEETETSDDAEGAADDTDADEAEATTTESVADGATEDAAESGEGAPEVSEMSARRPNRFRGASPAYLRSRSSAPEPRPQPREFMEATAFSKDPEGTVYESPSQVAAALWKKQMSLGNYSGPRDELSIATGQKQWADETPVVLGVDPQENLIVLRGGQESAKAMVASGAQCTPQNQLYDFFRLAEPIRSVEDSIPTVLAPRGGIRYIQANCTIAGAGAVGIWGTESPPVTAGAIDPTTGEKPCDTVTCPNIQEVLVEAVTKCMVFDNLQYRTFPELIENFQEDVAVQFQILKERYYLDKIDAAATAATGIGAYGAARALVYDLRVAAAGYRKRHHMPRGARLNVLMPDWSVDLIKMDLFYDGDNGLNFMNVPDSAVVEALSNDGLDVTFYYDNPTQVQANEDNSSVGLTLAQAAGALNDFAPTVTSYMYAPGTWVKLDGGSLDVGLVRDHALNKTNDFAMFMEEWIGIAQLGCETIRIDSDVCATGSRAPYASALRACAGYGS
jgi:hypothetical protein